MRGSEVGHGPFVIKSPRPFKFRDALSGFFLLSRRKNFVCLNALLHLLWCDNLLECVALFTTPEKL